MGNGRTGMDDSDDGSSAAGRLVELERVLGTELVAALRAFDEEQTAIDLEEDLMYARRVPRLVCPPGSGEEEARRVERLEGQLVEKFREESGRILDDVAERRAENTAAGAQIAEQLAGRLAELVRKARSEAGPNG